MFEHLAVFPKIIVTGPQRSGTTITSHMIVRDLRSIGVWVHVDEGSYGVHDEAKFMKYINLSHRVVIQAPAMLHMLPHYATRDDVAVIMMMRDLKDIVESQRRIGWVHEHKALEPFVNIGFIDSSDPGNHSQSIVKYQYWRQKKGIVKNAFEVPYDSLKNHPMYIPKEQRMDFKPKQIM